MEILKKTNSNLGIFGGIMSDLEKIKNFVLNNMGNAEMMAIVQLEQKLSDSKDACENKQKEIDELINASRMDFDKWYSSGMRKDFFEEKKAYDLYYNYTKDVCTYRNLAVVKEKNEALNSSNSYKLLSEKLQTENAQLKEALKNCPILGEVYRDSNDRFKEWNLEFKYVLKELENK